MSDRGVGSSAKEETPKGRRIFVFMVGGMIRSEVGAQSTSEAHRLWPPPLISSFLGRVQIKSAHILTQKLEREVVMGSTSLDIPSTFLEVRASETNLRMSALIPGGFVALWW